MNDNDNNNIQTENPHNYLDKHFSYKQQQKLEVYLEIDNKVSDSERFETAPSLVRKAKALVTAVLDKEGTMAVYVLNINPTLGNLDCLRYENRKRGGNKESESARDLFIDFEELEQEYPSFFTPADVTCSSFIITLRAPLMIKYTNFRAFPCVTGVTCSAFQKGRYLCSTIMYFSEIRKRALAFQAVIIG